MLQLRYLKAEVTLMTKITLGPDGKYRWTYELKILKNPTVFILVWKVLAFSVLLVFAFVITIDLVKNGFGDETLVTNLKAFAIAMLVVTVLVALGVLIYAAIMGGSYIVDFELDEKGVFHSQSSAQAKKAKKLGAATAAAGALSGRPTTAGIGLAATRTEIYTEFDRVRSVKAYRRRHLIKVNGLLSRNQVYADGADFDFVLEYIASRVPEKAKIKR
ncbi:MAG: hypothetical protein IIU14_04365 [Ruminococcus sp.]|nr:hypothetical protein [Ruminococcus sp.]